jgi:hypothetical protein
VCAFDKNFGKRAKRAVLQHDDRYWIWVLRKLHGQHFQRQVLAEGDRFAERRVFIRIYQDRAANVRHVSEMIDHFPYDLLLIATHCGDSSGYRWTYEFKDSAGLDRTFVVDIAIGLAHGRSGSAIRHPVHAVHIGRWRGLERSTGKGQAACRNGDVGFRELD